MRTERGEGWVRELLGGSGDEEREDVATRSAMTWRRGAPGRGDEEREDVATRGAGTWRRGRGDEDVAMRTWRRGSLFREKETLTRPLSPSVT